MSKTSNITRSSTWKLGLVHILPISCLLFFSLPAAASALAASDHASQETQPAAPWQVWRENEHARVRYRPATGTSLIEISASLKVSSTLSGFLLFLQDYTNIPNWLANASSARLLTQVSPRENIFMTRFDGFWPVKAREMFIHSTYRQNPDLSVEIAVFDAADKIDNASGAIRIKIIKGHWQLRPTTNRQLNIHYSLIASPEGKLPLWLANKLSLRAMWQTLQALHKQLPSSPWQQKRLPGIIEHMP